MRPEVSCLLQNEPVKCLRICIALGSYVYLHPENKNGEKTWKSEQKNHWGNISSRTFP